MNGIKNLINKMSSAMKRSMNGIYGFDELSRDMMYIAFICSVLAGTTGCRIISLLCIAFYSYSLFRIFSKNTSKRYSERNKYLGLMAKMSNKFYAGKRRLDDKKTHRYIKCPVCKTLMRVPKGEGKIRIHCPECGVDVIRNV